MIIRPRHAQKKSRNINTSKMRIENSFNSTFHHRTSAVCGHSRILQVRFKRCPVSRGRACVTRTLNLVVLSRHDLGFCQEPLLGLSQPFVLDRGRAKRPTPPLPTRYCVRYCRRHASHFLFEVPRTSTSCSHQRLNEVKWAKCCYHMLDYKHRVSLSRKYIGWGTRRIWKGKNLHMEVRGDRNRI